jgi:hypothetical protein
MKRDFNAIFCNLPFLSRFWIKMFTLINLGIFVAVGNALILKVKIWSRRLLFYPNSVTKHEYGR